MTPKSDNARMPALTIRQHLGSAVRLFSSWGTRVRIALCFWLSHWFAGSWLPWAIRVRATLLGLTGLRVGVSTFIDSGFRCLYPGNVQIGHHVSLGHDNHIWSFTPVSIGSYTITAKDLLIISAAHDVASFEPLPGQEVEIGPGCWIGARVTIIGGASIGRGCVIGAGSLVRGNIPPWSVAAGVPARVIKQREPTPVIWNPFGPYSRADLDELTAAEAPL